MIISKQSKLLRSAATIVAVIFASNSILGWYVGMLGLKDPFVLAPKSEIIARPLSIEWMVGIWAFQFAQLLFSIVVIYLVWRAFVMVLDIHQTIGNLKRHQEQ